MVIAENLLGNISVYGRKVVLIDNQYLFFTGSAAEIWYSYMGKDALLCRLMPKIEKWMLKITNWIFTNLIAIVEIHVTSDIYL